MEINTYEKSVYPHAFFLDKEKDYLAFKTKNHSFLSSLKHNSLPKSTILLLLCTYSSYL